jgi:pantoate--beta-alanine ligase
MQIIHTIAELRAHLGTTVRPVLVPTMGNLHDGHLSLVRIARSRGQPVVATVFVNRLQFAPTDDFDQYPRTLAQDGELLSAAGCDILFAPSEGEMYPEPQGFAVHPPSELANILEGQFRPGFFTGVCTVVLKLFHITQPACAVFGKKDFQQLLVIRNMVRQLALPIDIVGAETVRDADGLAMSSRNGYLTADQRREALQLHAVLRQTADAVAAGHYDWNTLEQTAIEILQKRGWVPDYLVIRRKDTLHGPTPGVPLVVLAAARLGTTRLIDNLEVR